MPRESDSSERRLHWDVTSQDYLRYRPGYPRSFFTLLRHVGIGLPAQRILDLGAGTGALAIPFAQHGARVTGVDLSEGQIQAAQEAAQRKKARIIFKVAPAENTGLPDHAFDVITASMCWGYFDEHRIVDEVLRLLAPNGRLLISSLHWIEEGGEIVVRTGALMSAYNPRAQRRSREAEREIIPHWSVGRFRLVTFHQYTTDISFTRRSWRGRIHASKWIGAALSQEKADAFDLELRRLLERIAPPRFTIAHRICLRIFEPSEPNGCAS